MKFCAWVFIGSAMLTTLVMVSIWVTTAWPLNFNFAAWENDPTRIVEEIRAAQRPLPPLWTTDGRGIVFNADAQMHVVDLREPSIRSFHAGREPSLMYAGSVSRSGHIAFTQLGHTRRDINFEMGLMKLDGSDKRILISGNRSNPHPKWSPNGDSIAVLANLPGNSPSLRIMDVSRPTNPIDIPGVIPSEEPPAWSPTGKMVAFIDKVFNANNNHQSIILVADVTQHTYANLVETTSLPGWSPDGQRIAFARNKRDVSAIHVINLNGTNLQTIASFPDVLPELKGYGSNYPLGGHDRLPRGHVSWSSDGSEIRLHQSPFVAVNADGSNFRIMRGRPDALASWSPDESQIAVYLPGREVRLFTMNADGSDKQSLVRWDRRSWGLVADRRPLDIDGFDWEAYPSTEGEQ